MLPQQVNKKGKMMQICLDFAGIYCGGIFQDIMKNSAQELVSWEQGEELPWLVGTSTSALPRRAGLGTLPCAKNCPGTCRLCGHFPSDLVIQLGCGLCRCPLALGLGRQVFHASPFHCSPDPVRAGHGPGAAFQSQMTPISGNRTAHCDEQDGGGSSAAPWAVAFFGW